MEQETLTDQNWPVSRLWEFYEEMNEIVYVVDMDSHEQEGNGFVRRRQHGRD